PYTVSQTSNASRAYEVKCFSTLPTLEEAFALKNGAQCRLVLTDGSCCAIRLSLKSVLTAWSRVMCIIGLVTAGLFAATAFIEGSMTEGYVASVIASKVAVVIIASYRVSGIGKASYARAMAVAEQLDDRPDVVTAIQAAYPLDTAFSSTLDQSVLQTSEAVGTGKRSLTESTCPEPNRLNGDVSAQTEDVPSVVHVVIGKVNTGKHRRDVRQLAIGKFASLCLTLF
ncbi:MAG: hypothetical protein ABGZ35_12890, partial [Planctomycetaceae bacterium]